jgi:hypothetical protein
MRSAALYRYYPGEDQRIEKHAINQLSQKRALGPPRTNIETFFSEVNVNKAVLLLLSLVYLLPLPASLQDYEFSYSEVSWQEITGGVLLGSESSDDQHFIDPAFLEG